jgi:hypothetical protein
MVTNWVGGYGRKGRVGDVERWRWVELFARGLEVDHDNGDHDGADGRDDDGRDDDDKDERCDDVGAEYNNNKGDGIDSDHDEDDGIGGDEDKSTINNQHYETTTMDTMERMAATKTAATTTT